MSLHAPKLLLIEDNPEDALIVRYLLFGQAPPYQVDTLSKGLECLARETYDLILLDLHLPDSDGLGSLDKLVPLVPDTPIILLTALDDDRIGAQAISRGAQDYLVKGQTDAGLLKRAIKYAIERKRSERVLRESHEFLQSTLDALSAHIAILDETGTIIAVNEAWRQFAVANGLETSDFCLGTNYVSICESAVGSGVDEARSVAARIRLMLAGELTGFYLEYPCHSPTEKRWYVVQLNRFQSKGLTRIVAAHYNISERILAEQAEREQRTLAEALRDVAVTINSTLDLEEIWDRILIDVGHVVPHDSACIVLVDGTIARVIRSRGQCVHTSAKTPQADETDLPVAALPFVPHMFETGRPFIFSSDVDPQWIELQIIAGFQSFIAAPIYREGQSFGFIGLKSARPSFFNQTHADRLQMFANQVAIAVYNAQLFNAEHKQRTLAEALSTSATILTSTLDFQVVMNRILMSVGQVVPHDAANIMLIRGGKVYTVARVGYQLPEAELPHQATFSLEVPHLSQMYTTGQPVCIPDTAAHPDWLTGQVNSWIQSYAAVPIQAHGEVIGFLNLDSRTAGFFTDAHIELLKAFAAQAAIAIENAQLYAELNGYANELEQRVEQRTTELNRVRERVEIILNHSSDPIVLVYADGNIRQVNPAFDTVFGYEKDESYGLSLFDLFEPASTPLLLESLKNVANQQQLRRIELMARRRDGTTFDVEVGISAITNETSHLGAIVCSMRDITERKQIELALREALQQEKELSELKSRFVSMASHEFRTPLATIQVSTESLKNYRTRMTDEQIDGRLQKIETQIKQMTLLLEDVLTIGHAQAGKIDFNPIWIDVAQLVQSIVDEFRNINTLQHRLVYTFSDVVACSHDRVDEKLFRQIVTNLISNAMKYSPPGSDVFLDLSCANGIVFSVRDQGIGIPEEDQKHLFEAFHRASNVGNIPGSGLGLSIAHYAVALHQGTLTFVSEVGVGTTFTVSIPIVNEDSELDEDSDY